jgi:hypothetical protein
MVFEKILLFHTLLKKQKVVNAENWNFFLFITGFGKFLDKYFEYFLPKNFFGFVINFESLKFLNHTQGAKITRMVWKFYSYVWYSR